LPNRLSIGIADRIYVLVRVFLIHDVHYEVIILMVCVVYVAMLLLLYEGQHSKFSLFLCNRRSGQNNHPVLLTAAACCSAI